MTTLEPPASLDKAKVDFIRRFYENSDREEVLDEYVEAFTPDADFIMGLAPFKGQDAIRKFRPSMWTAISYRKHSPRKVYLGGDANELMLYGTVDYKLRKSGSEVNGVQWAGRMVFEASADKPRLSFYQVWLVRSLKPPSSEGRSLTNAQDSTAVKEALAKEVTAS